MGEPMAPRVTVVNDSPEFLELVGDILADERIPTVLVNGERPDALDRIRDSRPDVLMLDLRMGSDELHGWDIAQQIRAEPDLADLPILICSADLVALESIKDQLDATRRVAALTKPFTIDRLTEAIAALHEPAR
jgi:CheY-like chemotaxis protein